MNPVVIPQVVEDRIGKAAAQALVEMVSRMIAEEKSSALSFSDERIAARYADIQRRMHEDVAGVEIRLGNRMSELENRMATFQNHMETKLSDLRAEMLKTMADWRDSIIRWIVASVVVQAGLMVLVAWLSKKF